MTNVKIREAFKTGWDNFMRRPWYLLGITIAMYAMFFFCTSQYILVTALAYILYGGYIAMFIKHYDHQQIVFDDLFSLDNRWISFAFMGLIKMLLIIAGLLLFVLPGVYLAVRFMFAELLVIDQNMRPLQALRQSAAMTKGHFWKLFLFGVMCVVLTLIGLLALGIGAAVAMTVVTFAAIRIYRDLQSA